MGLDVLSQSLLPLYPECFRRAVVGISRPPRLGGGRPGAEVKPKLGWMTEALEIDPFNSNRIMYGTGRHDLWKRQSDRLGSRRRITNHITVMAEGLEETAVTA